MSSDAQILAPPATASQADPRRWLTLVILLLAGFMNLLDVSIVNIAIPSIQRDLHASYADVQWALAGYTLAYALVLITGGRLGDTFGRKRLFLIGVASFTIMSALCGAATSPGMLIGCRVAQGAMGAIMVPQVLAVIQVIFPPRERIKALAGFGVTAGLGTVSGPLLGGLLIQHNLFGLGWRPIFLINVPVGVIAFAASAVLVRESKAANPPRLDPVGVGLISAALLLLLYPLVEGRQLGWPLWTYVSMALCVPVRPRSSGTSGSRAAATARRWCRSACSPTARSVQAWAWPSRSSSASPHSPWCSPCSCSSAWGSARCTPG